MHSGHRFRRGDLFQILPFRRYIREKCPSSADGLDVLDLDLVPLLFGALVGRTRHEDGKFMLVEVKHKDAIIGHAQLRLFRMMHRLLRQADPDREHYIGCYVLGWDSGSSVVDMMRCPKCGEQLPEPDAGKPVFLNGKPITEEEFFRWLTGLERRASLLELDEGKGE